MKPPLGHRVKRTMMWHHLVVDLRPHLLALLSPRAIGDAIIPGVKLADASTELGLRLRFDVDGQRLWVEIAPREPESKFAAATDRLALSYRTEGGRSPVPERVGFELCGELATLMRGNEARVLSNLERESGDDPERDARVRKVQVQHLLDLAGPRGASYYTLNPYVGCLVGCRFCYAQSNLSSVRRLLGLRDAKWGSYVEVRSNAAEVLARELAELPLAPLKFCPIVSDPYHAIERRELVTRDCLRAIRDADRVWPTLIMTRSGLIRRDIELLASLPQVWGSVSLPTADDEVRAHFEPRAASIAERLAILKDLRSAGVRTIAVVQPMLEGSVDALADALADTVESVSIDILRGVEDAGDLFDDPRYEHTRAEPWQTERALALKEKLLARGVDVWHSELPPELCRSEQSDEPTP